MCRPCSGIHGEDHAEPCFALHHAGVCVRRKLLLLASARECDRYAEVPPRVEYELTPLGRGLSEPVLALVSWLQSNWPVIRSARDRFDARKQVTSPVARPRSSTAIRG